MTTQTITNKPAEAHAAIVEIAQGLANAGHSAEADKLVNILNGMSDERLSEYHDAGLRPYVNEAKDLTLRTGNPHMIVDRGPRTHPRYAVVRTPKVGDPVSRAFNGDYYPDGVIIKISPSLKVITTDTGTRFYRWRESGWWRANGMWSMVHGHHNERNPSF